MAGPPIPLLPPAEAIDFFRAKGFKVGFAWQDVWQEEHARAFTVAKAMSRDVLETIREAVDEALAKGETLETFRAKLTPLLQAKGWWGRKRMIDPATGLARTVQLGSPRRLKIIYDMNMRMARAAGRWEKIQRTKDALPYLRYTAVMDERTRPQHAEWHGTILPVDDPWWDTHYPPCGWNCRCTVIQLDAGTIADNGWEVSDAPPPDGPPDDYVNPRTGETIKVPAGIDPGFAYNVGKSALGGLEPPPLPAPDLPMLAGVAPGAPPPGAPSPPSLLPANVSEAEAVDAFLAGALEPGEPVAQLTGEEIAPKSASIAELRRATRKWFNDFRDSGETIINPALGDVRISRRGVREAIAQSPEARGGEEKLRATPAVPDVIRRGRVRFEANTDLADKPDVLGYARVSAPVKIGEDVRTVEALLEQRADGHWYYNHRLLEARGGRPYQSAGVSGEAGQDFPAGLSTSVSGGRPGGEDIASFPVKSSPTPAAGRWRSARDGFATRPARCACLSAIGGGCLA